MPLRFFRTIIVAILRIIYLVELNTAEDYTYTAVDCWIWSVLEPSLAAMVACGPTLGPAIAACLGRVRSTIKSSKATSSSGGQYPSYLRNTKQFSNISDSEHPLQNLYGNCTTAGTATGGQDGAGKIREANHEPIKCLTPEEIEERNSNLFRGENESYRARPGIRVQRDVRIRRYPSSPTLLPA